MAAVHVIQRNAHLAAAVRLEHVQGNDGPISKATFTAISNRRARGRDERADDDPTAIAWTLWGKAAENAARYLGKGSHVNVIGTVRIDRWNAADGSPAYRLVFTADEVDYLDTRAEAEARRNRHEFVDEVTQAEHRVDAH